MAKLSAEERKELPKSKFGEPAKKKYPMPDKSHAANAKARASQAVNAGRMSKGEESKIDAKANKVLGKGKSDYHASGGKVHRGKPTVSKGGC